MYTFPTQPNQPTQTPPALTVAETITRYDVHSARMFRAGHYVALEQARIAAAIMEAEAAQAAANEHLTAALDMMARIEERAEGAT